MTSDGRANAALLMLAEQAQQIGEMKARLDAQAEQLAVLHVRAAGKPAQAAGRKDSGTEPEGYEPRPCWWTLEGAERDAAITRLAAWVDQVYRPCYGHLSAKLPDCWAEHPLALFALDWMVELHSVLYRQPERTRSALAGQAEWQTRLVPAAAEQIAAECRGCQHARTPVVANGTRR